MQQKETMYRNLSIVLGLIALVFIVLYFTKPSTPVSETLGSAFTDVKTCRDNIAVWQQGVMGNGEVTINDRTELNMILDKCKTAIENAQAKI